MASRFDALPGEEDGDGERKRSDEDFSEEARRCRIPDSKHKIRHRHLPLPNEVKLSNPISCWEPFLSHTLQFLPQIYVVPFGLTPLLPSLRS